MLNPERILSASSDELRLWCALLDGYRWVMYENDFCRWLESTGSADRYGFKRAIVPADMSLPPAGNPFAWVNDYTMSLDDIWPLQEATILRSEGRGGRGYRYWLKRVLTSNDHNIVLKYVRATAEQRARAVCLARLDELNELLKEDN